MDISQRESLNVTRPPVPARLPLKRSILSKNTLSFKVTVYDAHHDSGMLELNVAGRPKSGRPSAIFSHSSQPWLSFFVRRGGALVIVPKLDASVIEALVKNTRSVGATATCRAAPSSS